VRPVPENLKQSTSSADINFWKKISALYRDAQPADQPTVRSLDEPLTQTLESLVIVNQPPAQTSDPALDHSLDQTAAQPSLVQSPNRPFARPDGCPTVGPVPRAIPQSTVRSNVRTGASPTTISNLLAVRFAAYPGIGDALYPKYTHY
jgi:hypothetical protein